MAQWCLIKSEADKFKQGLKSGKLNPFALAGLSSAERRAKFGEFVSEDNAKNINALFEGKLLLKNQKAGYINWAKQVAGITPQVRRDLITKIEKLEKVLDPQDSEKFLEDLVAKRLGVEVTQEEAKQIATLAKQERDLKVKANEKGEFSSEEDRLAYGESKVALESYMQSLKRDAQRVSFREEPVRKVIEAVGNLPGALKSTVASLDNSFWGRQGIKTLLDVRTAPIWAKNFLKSWGDITKQLKAKTSDDVVLDAIKSDIYSRPNALNGKYEAGGYGLGVMSEEAYPSSLPEKIPLLGRLFKASEAAYNGGALRLRADLADRFIAIAEKQGINTLNREEAQGIGQLVSSLTGRGSLPMTRDQQKVANILLFSIKFLKGNIDTLTAHRFDPKATDFTRKEAAKNLLSMVASVAAILTLAKLIDPESVDEDPRSTNFGKVKVFGRWQDITGGMSSLVSLASRLVPTKRNGEWGMWKKSASGKWTNLTAGEYGGEDAFDLLVNGLFANKLSPIAGIFRDIWRGETFDGGPPTLEGELKNVTVPLTIQTGEEILKDKNASFPLGSIILEGLGLSGSSYSPKSNWETSTSKTLTQFKEKVGDDTFKTANDDFNRVYQEWYTRTIETDAYKTLSDESKKSLLSSAKETIQKQILKEYGFSYKEAPKSRKDLEEKQRVKALAPQ